MKRKQFYLLAASVAFLIVFHVIAFAFPFERTRGFWIEYVCSALAIILFLGVTAAFCIRETPMKSKFLDWPVLYVSYVLLIVQLCVGFAVMALPMIPYWAALIVSALILGGGAILILTVKPSADEIERVGESVSSKVNYIQRIYAKTDVMAKNAGDKALSGELKKLAEDIRFSDPMSNGELYEMECEIEREVDKLGEILARADYGAAPEKIREIRQVLQERNIKCKMLK